MSFLKKKGVLQYVPAVIAPKWVPGYFVEKDDGYKYQLVPTYSWGKETVYTKSGTEYYVTPKKFEGYKSMYVQTYKTVYVPGQWYEAEVEGSKYVMSPNPGFNSGAVSIDFIQQPQIDIDRDKLPGYRFKVKRESLGVYIGLAVDSVGISTDYILNGIYLTQGQWRPVVNGQKIAGGGAYVGTTEFTLRLTPSGVDIESSEGDSEFMPSIMPSSVRLHAVLYLQDDEIIEASAINNHTGVASGVLAPVFGVAADRPVGVHDGTLASLAGAGGVFNKGAGTLAPLIATGWAGLGMSGKGVLAAMESSAWGGPYEPYAYHYSTLAPVDGLGILKSGHTGNQIDGNLSPMYVGVAWGGFDIAPSGQKYGLLACVQAEGYGEAGSIGSVVIGGGAYSLSEMVATAVIAVVLNSLGQIITILDAQAILGATLSSQGQALGGMDGDMSLLAYIDSVVRGADGLQGQSFTGGGQEPNPDQQMPGGTEDYDGGYFVWVFNIRTGAVSRYLRYGFDSFAQIGGHYFGVAEDGVYLLGGNTDADQRIEARAGTGLLDLGAKELKHVSAVYLDAASDGVLSVRVQAGQQQYTYQARRASQHNAQQRVDTGRGLRATHYSFELLNGGADFELDAMDVNVAKSARRI